ncbi:MAG: methyl-accepting chemotaxis protein [Magnetovibrio sp.]|nr:methyl-accepting chemotaxis protein [Magnetovibrio sp.]
MTLTLIMMNSFQHLCTRPKGKKMLSFLKQKKTKKNKTSKMQDMISVCTSICAGDFEARILNIPVAQTEERQLCLLINEMINRFDAYVRESTACLGYIEKNRYFRRVSEEGMVGSFGVATKTINKAADEIEKNTLFLNDLVGSLNVVSDQFRQKAEGMGDCAKETNERSSCVAASAEEALVNIQTVAAASEELTASIQEITLQVTNSSSMANEAEQAGKKANEIITTLSGRSREIDEIIKLINDIASQTNLLALNATIEAARAGEAGKGFAVVANEVKNLATQTGKATEGIQIQVSEIQNSTQEAVSAIDAVNKRITNLGMVTSAIAAAIEEQGAATNEIARNISEATLGISNITESISEVAENVGAVSGASAEVIVISSELTKQAGTLKQSLLRKA